MDHLRLSVFLAFLGIIFGLGVHGIVLCASAEGTPSNGSEIVRLIAGGGDGADGALAIHAKLHKPFAVAFDREGIMYVGEYEGCRVLKVDDKGVLTTFAGTGVRGFSGDSGPAEKGQFNLIHDVVIGPDGNVYVADTNNHRVRKIDMKTGVLSTFAGAGRIVETGAKASGDGGPADRAGLDGVGSLWFSPNGDTLYISGFSKFVRTVDMKTGIISTIRNCPGGRSIAVDSKGNLYIAAGPALRVRTPEGVMTTLLDKTHLGGADLPLADNPKHLAIDADDNVLICDEGHHLLRKYVAADHKLLTVVGSGKPGSAGLGGPARRLELNRPHGVYVLPTDGSIYIADSWNDRVVKIETKEK